jgi:hypothetical protein
MIRPTALFPVAAVLALTVFEASPALAQASASRSGSASITVIRPLSVSVDKVLNFGRLQPQQNGANVSATIAATLPAVRTSDRVSLLSGGTETPGRFLIRGEPGRTYRISLPASVASSPGNYVVNSFTAWTASNGNAGATISGQFNSSGNDTVQIGATIRFTQGAKQDVFTAAIPINIAYE